jgi:poly(3-hydroxybutyrate) depolymerase
VMADGHEVAIHEMAKIAKAILVTWIRFKRFSDDVETIKRLKEDPSVLIVAPLSGHHASNT